MSQSMSSEGGRILEREGCPEIPLFMRPLRIYFCFLTALILASSNCVAQSSIQQLGIAQVTELGQGTAFVHGFQREWFRNRLGLPTFRVAASITPDSENGDMLVGKRSVFFANGCYFKILEIHRHDTKAKVMGHLTYYQLLERPRCTFIVHCRHKGSKPSE